MSGVWGVGKSTHYPPSGEYKRVTYYYPVVASNPLRMCEYSIMSYDEAQAISKLLNAINQGE
jgi:hypothetical protein